MVKAAFIGLGVMGYPMAGHLAKNGHDVTVYNRTTAKADAWAKEHGGAAADTPAKAAAGADVVFSCVGNDDDLRSVVYGDDGILAGMAKGPIYCDHTTASATVAREIGEAAGELGIGFLDGPVSGGQAGAENGALTVMVGGEKKDFDVIKPVADSYGKAVTLMGPVGVDVISKGAAQSWQMDNRAETMINDEFEFGFAVEWMRKDIGIAMAEARSNGALLPATALVDQLYGEVVAMGGSRWDTSSLIRLLTRKAG